MPYPDVELMLAGWLRDYLNATTGNVRVVTDTPSNLATVLPLVQVTRFGGADTVPGLDRATVDVDAYAGTRGNAAVLAEKVRYGLRFVLPGQQVGTLTVSRVDTLVGPSWRPYDNSSLRRFGASYSLTVHAKTIREVAP